MLFRHSWNCDPLQLYTYFWLASDFAIAALAAALLVKAYLADPPPSFKTSIILATCGLVASLASIGYLLLFHLLHSCENTTVDGNYSIFVGLDSFFSGVSQVSNLTMYWMAALNYFFAQRKIPQLMMTHDHMQYFKIPTQQEKMAEERL